MSSFGDFRDTTLWFFSKNGWILVAAAAGFGYFFVKVVKPLLDAERRDAEAARQKKFDEDVSQKVTDRMAEVRAAQEAAVQKASAEKRRRDEENRLKKLENDPANMVCTKDGCYLGGGPPAEKTSSGTQRITDYYKWIEETARSYPVVVFSKSWCPFCTKVKKLLSSYRLSSEEFLYIELNAPELEIDVEAVAKIFGEKYGARSVPRVFIGGELLGGCDDTEEALHSGVLDSLISTALGDFKAANKQRR